jgi:hypothetical protein
MINVSTSAQQIEKPWIDASEEWTFGLADSMIPDQKTTAA